MSSMSAVIEAWMLGSSKRSASSARLAGRSIRSPIGASLAGAGAGVLIKRQGYEVTFVVFGLAAILGALFVCLIWKVGPETRKTG